MQIFFIQISFLSLEREAQGAIQRHKENAKTENTERSLKFDQYIVVVVVVVIGDYTRFSQLLKQELRSININIFRFPQFFHVFMDMLSIIFGHLLDLHVKKVKSQPYLSVSC